MFTFLADPDSPLRLLNYLTFRMFGAAVTAMLIGFLIGPWMIERLRRLNFAQSLRERSEVGKLADLHAAKKNTPTMGGLIIFVAITVSTLLWAAPTTYVLVCLIVYAGLTAVGFADDYLKVSKKNSKGLSSRYKLFWQAVLTGIALLLLFTNKETAPKMAQLWVPFVKEPVLAVMPLWFVAIFFFLVMAGSSNAINLTDGVDGLAIGCTITVAMVYAVMAYAAGNTIVSDYLLISYVPGGGELAVLCAALLGASMAFLWFNSYPASVFMGDTGSLALGGVIGTVAFIVHQPLTLVLVGGIFVLEAVSVILQVGSFKMTGKRIFRMAPLHHHFELKGWHESKVVIRFWIVSLIFALMGLATLKLR